MLVADRDGEDVWLGERELEALGDAVRLADDVDATLPVALSGGVYVAVDVPVAAVEESVGARHWLPVSTSPGGHTQHHCTAPLPQPALCVW